MNYHDFITEDLRLCFLKMLQLAPTQTLNNQVMATALFRMGFNLPTPKIHSVASWLADADCIRIETLSPLFIYHLTAQGGDIADGKSHMPGIAKIVNF